MSVLTLSHRDLQVFDRKQWSPIWVGIDMAPAAPTEEHHVAYVDWENDPFLKLEPMRHGGPPDTARNLEHYLYGAPKK